MVFTAAGTSDGQVVDAVSAALAATLGVEKSELFVEVAQKLGRRMAASIWVVRYKVVLPPFTAPEAIRKMLDAVAAPESFGKALTGALVQRGAVQGSVSLRSFVAPAIIVAPVTTPVSLACGTNFCPAGQVSESALTDAWCASLVCAEAAVHCCTGIEAPLPTPSADQAVDASIGIAIPVSIALLLVLVCCATVCCMGFLQLGRGPVDEHNQNARTLDQLHGVVPKPDAGNVVSPNGIEMHFSDDEDSATFWSPSNSPNRHAKDPRGLMLDDMRVTDVGVISPALPSAEEALSAKHQAKLALALQPAVGEWRLFQDGLVLPGVIAVAPSGRTLYGGVHYQGQDIVPAGSGFVRSDGWAANAALSSPNELVWSRAGEVGVVWHRVREVTEYFVGDKVAVVTADRGVPVGAEGDVLDAKDGMVTVDFLMRGTAKLRAQDVIALEELKRHRQGDAILASLVDDWRLYSGDALLPGLVSIGSRGFAVYDGARWPEQDLLFFGDRVARVDGWAVDMHASTKQHLLWGKDGEGIISWRRVKAVSEYIVGDIVELVHGQPSISPGSHGSIVSVAEGNVRVKFSSATINLMPLDIVPVVKRDVVLPTLAKIYSGAVSEDTSPSRPSPPRTTTPHRDLTPVRALQIEVDMDVVGVEQVPSSLAAFGGHGAPPTPTDADRPAPAAFLNGAVRELVRAGSLPSDPGTDLMMVFAKGEERPVLYQQTSCTVTSPVTTPTTLEKAHTTDLLGRSPLEAPPGTAEVKPIATQSGLSWWSGSALTAVTGPIGSGMSGISAMILGGRREEPPPSADAPTTGRGVAAAGGSTPPQSPDARTPVSDVGAVSLSRPGTLGSAKDAKQEQATSQPQPKPKRERRQILV